MYKEITSVVEVLKRQKDQIDLSKVEAALSFLPAEFSKGMIALLTLQAATYAVNNDDPAEPVWEADYNNDDQAKWFPWYRGGDTSGSGFRFMYSYGGWTITDGGARLALKDEARSDHMNKYFSDLYKELYLILK